MSFNMYVPTKVLFGQGQLNLLGEQRLPGKKAMIAIGNSEYLKERNCRLLLQVHDEVIAECPQEYAKECSEELSRLMVEAASEKISVPMQCDAAVSYEWYGEELHI